MDGIRNGLLREKSNTAFLQEVNKEISEPGERDGQDGGRNRRNRKKNEERRGGKLCVIRLSWRECAQKRRWRNGGKREDNPRYAT